MEVPPEAAVIESTENPEKTSKIEEETAKTEEEIKDLDPYAYLDRDFCSEKFKIEVNHLPKFYGFKELKKLINQTLKLNSAKIKAISKNSKFIFICFHNEEEREAAINVLNNYSWKKSKLKAFKSTASQDPLLKKRKQEANANSKEPKQAKLDLKERICKYWNLPYEQQLLEKEADVKMLLRKVATKLKNIGGPIKSYVEKQQEKYAGLPCELLATRFSQIVDNYRNKCEFSVGLHHETGEKTVGFRMGAYSQGSVSVGGISDLPHVPQAMKTAVEVFEMFVRESSLGVYNPVDQSGEFRQLTVRTTSGDELMLIVGISPRCLNEQQIADLKQQLIEFFFQNERGLKAKVTSLYYEPIIKKKSDDDTSGKPVFLQGNPFIYETILGMKFRISAESFFQINTKCAEVLFETAMELAQLNQQTTLVDVCCGTGTIGICCAKSCSQVLGLDIVPEAIEDAKRNAVENQLTNCQFFSGKAEEILYSVVTRAENDDVVAITDPPRAGLRKAALLSLRRVEKIKKVVFIACNPHSSFENFLDLARLESKTVHGSPFVPTKAVIVDMFPHTQHYELVLLLERLENV